MGIINTEVAAARLGISTRRIRAMIATGVLPATKLGRDWVVDESEVELLKVIERKPGRPKGRREKNRPQ